jgi:hypothetical protein
MDSPNLTKTNKTLIINSQILQISARCCWLQEKLNAMAPFPRQFMVNRTFQIIQWQILQLLLQLLQRKNPFYSCTPHQLLQLFWSCVPPTECVVDTVTPFTIYYVYKYRYEVLYPAQQELEYSKNCQCSRANTFKLSTNQSHASTLCLSSFHNNTLQLVLNTTKWLQLVGKTFTSFL